MNLEKKPQTAETRELICLGTSGEGASRYRNPNGYFLRWDSKGILFDPGEGTQRQLILAGISAQSISAIFITHFHIDHCLGLPGLVDQFVNQGRREPVEIYYPASGQTLLDALLGAVGINALPAFLLLRPLSQKPQQIECGEIFAFAAPLIHSVDTLGYRICSRKTSTGCFAFVMDSILSEGCLQLAKDADLVVCESTYLNRQSTLAAREFHMTAGQAAELANQASSARLLLTHFSPVYAEVNEFLHEARRTFAAVDVARDLNRYSVGPCIDSGS